MSVRHRIAVDHSAIVHNATLLRELVSPAELWAVVKADGYGHGAETAARGALAGGATRLACATLGEARALRSTIAEAVPVIVLTPLIDGEEDEADGFEVVISSLRAFERLAASRVAVGVHLKVDSGMGRWGMSPDAARWTSQAIAADPRLSLVGVLSHLATADEDDQTFLVDQLARFREAARRLPSAPRHLANSAAALLAPATHFDAVRCGIALYGISPQDRDARAFGLLPALRWTSHVAATKELATGDSVGYGRRFVASERARIALVPVGYADGFPRAASGTAEVLIRGRRRRVAATVSMDQLSVIVSDDVEVGDDVVIVGDQGQACVTIEELARAAGTIGYEVVCGIGNASRRGERVTAPTPPG